MKIFKTMKDGGPESTVTGYWLIEWKKVFSICLLNFQGTSRPVFHNHAFNCFSWLLTGCLKETFLEGLVVYHFPSIKPFITRRGDFHKVDSTAKGSWLLTFRGPWASYWDEYVPETGEYRTLTKHRQIV